MANSRETNEPKKRTLQIVALCVVLATIITVWVLACKIRTLRAEVERLDAAYEEATKAVRETTALLEQYLDDLEPGD